MFRSTHSDSSSFGTSPFIAVLNSPEVAWGMIALYFCASLLLPWAGLARVVNLAYPAGAFLIGVFLYFRFPVLYVGFTWWVWLVSPFIRRIVDFRSAFTAPSPILLAPFLVTLVTFYTVIKYLPRAFKTDSLPYFLAFSSVVFTLFLGLINHAPSKVAEQLLDLGLPLSFGFHLYVNWQNYPLYRDNFKRVFAWGILLLAIYGIFQFMTAPEWDTQWLINSDYQSGGQPKPFKIRVWSMLNSAGPFASVMMSGLLLLLDVPGKIKLPAIVLGFVSFLLSQHRSSWLSWLLGFFNIAGASSPRKQIRLFITVGILGVLLLSLAGVEQFSGILGDRFESLLSLEDDGSSLARKAEYAEFLVPALSQVVGYGLGGLGHDSGVLYFLLNFGWIGTLLYFGGLVLPLFKLYQTPYARQDSFLVIARAVIVSLLIQLPTVISTNNIQGMILWAFLSLGVAGEKYYLNTDRLNKEMLFYRESG